MPNRRVEPQGVTDGGHVREDRHRATRPDGDHRLVVGDRVEVRRRFDDAWARGFAVARVVDNRFELRRLSDGAILPALFDLTDLRPEAR